MTLKDGPSAVVTRRPVDPIATLLGLVAGGDQDALAALYAQTATAVRDTVTATLRDRQHAEEVTQEVYLELWLHSAAGFDPQLGSGRVYLGALARRRAIDRIRSVEAARRRDSAWHPAASADSDFADASISRVEIQSALRALGDRASTIIAVYYQGQSYQQIATQLGVPISTVKNRHRRALVALRLLIQA